MRYIGIEKKCVYMHYMEMWRHRQSNKMYFIDNIIPRYEHHWIFTQHCTCKNDGMVYHYRKAMALKGRAHDFRQLLFICFYCLLCFTNAFLIIKQNFSVSRKAIRKTQSSHFLLNK